MKLTGFAFAGATGPVTDGYVALGDLTAIVGTNDAGKSRMLALLVRALDDSMPAQEQEEMFAIYAQLSSLEIQAVIGATGTHQISFSGEAGFGHQTAAHYATDDPGSYDHVKRALGMLAVSNTFVFCRCQTGDWAVFWCVNPPVLGESVDAAIEDTFARLQMVSSKSNIRRSLQDFLSGGLPSELVHDASPRAVLELGEVSRSALPQPLRVPVDTEALEEQVAQAIDIVSLCLSWWADTEDEVDRFEEDIGEYDGASLEEGLEDLTKSLIAALTPRPDRNHIWLRQSESGTNLRLSDATAIAAARLSEVANASLPPFIAERYDVTVQIRPLLEWTAEDPVSVGLIPEGETEAFPLTQAADGLQLWVEIAVLEGVRAMSATASRVGRVLNDARATASELGEAEERFQTAQHALDESDPDEDREEAERAEAEADWERQSVAETRVELVGGIGELRRVLIELREWDGPVDSDWVSASNIRLGGTRSDHRVLLYVMDEPERYLHPRLARLAARWLADLTEARGVQAVVVTHSIPFLRASPGCRHAFVRRTGATATVSNLLAEELEAVSEITAEIGLDSGDLLAGTNVVLFVEGRSDRYVLETLFSRQLRAAGIVVLPFHGTGKKENLLDVEVIARFTAARIAVLFDDTHDSVLRELTNASHEKLAAFKKKPDAGGKLLTAEEKHMASLLLTAREAGRQIHPYGIPTHDIFDLLSDDAIRAEFPKWPGHRRFAEVLGQAVEAYGPDVKLKRLREERYDVPVDSDDWYARIAERMKDSPPRELVALVERLELLALGHGFAD